VTESQIGAAMKKHRGFNQMQRVYQTLIGSLEYRRSGSIQRKPDDVAKITARIKQRNLDLESVREQARQHIINSQMPGMMMHKLVFPTSSKFLGFGAMRWFSVWWIACPHWFPVLICGAVPILIGTRQRLRFSLRTLLMATTLLAMFLKAIVYAVR
jgi:hypothetical protein